MSQSRQRTIPTTLSPQKNFERVVSSKNREYIKERVFKDEITTNNYVDSLIVDVRLFDQKLFEIINTHGANGIHFKILACVEPEQWHELKAETALAASSKTYEVSTQPWAYVKFQVKSQVADTAGKVTAHIAAQS